MLAKSTTGETFEVEQVLPIICEALNQSFDYMRVEKEWIQLFYKSKFEQEDVNSDDYSGEKTRYEIEGTVYDCLYTNKIEHWIKKQAANVQIVQLSLF